MLCALPLALALGFCPDETISGYAEPTATWNLTELDGVPFTAPATIAFPAAGEVVGTGPCNSFTATQAVPYPWIEIRKIAATRRACPDLEAEAAYFSALEAMTLAEAQGSYIILSTPDGREMVFTAGEAAD